MYSPTVFSPECADAKYLVKSDLVMIPPTESFEVITREPIPFSIIV